MATARQDSASKRADQLRRTLAAAVWGTVLAAYLDGRNDGWRNAPDQQCRCSVAARCRPAARPTERQMPYYAPRTRQLEAAQRWRKGGSR